MAVTLQASTVLVPGGTVTFYLHDDDLNTSHRGIDEVSTSGLLEFKLAGMSITGPSSITETDANSGVFVGKIAIPNTVNGRPVTQGDVLVITYNDESDFSGNVKSTSKSITAKKINTGIEVSQKNIRIGQTFQVRIYDQDFNLDARRADNISLKLIEFRGSNGIRTALDNPVFEAKTNSLRETGDNTNQFVVTLKMPKKINGKEVDIGSNAELRFTDTTSPSGTIETVKTKIKIGLK
ncbi:MAG: hypothetical protein FJ357_07560 [Thaumarchaeota archaeon]|nr:hypothetical protein [Nitrososphaerota archaeon]